MAKSATKKKPSKQPDLFDSAPRAAKAAARKPAAGGSAKAAGRGKPARGRSAESGYTAKHIEVLEGLEPVRRRPGMYIGGTDEKALHHLFAEVIDNSMDEALAGHADWIEVEMEADGFVSVTDNGRGFDPDEPARGLGLTSLRQRARKLGGVLTIESVPARGTTLRLEVPLPRRGIFSSR